MSERVQGEKRLVSSWKTEGENEERLREGGRGRSVMGEGSVSEFRRKELTDKRRKRSKVGEHEE